MIEIIKVSLIFPLLLASTVGAAEDKEGIVSYYGSSNVRNQSPSLPRSRSRTVLAPGMRPALPSLATVSSPSIEVSQLTFETSTSEIPKLQSKDKLESEVNTNHETPSTSLQASRLRALLQQRSPQAKPPISPTLSLRSAIPLQPNANAVPTDKTTESLIIIYPEAKSDPVPLSLAAVQPQSEPVLQNRPQMETLLRRDPQALRAISQPQASTMQQPESQSRLSSILKALRQTEVVVPLPIPDPQTILSPQPEPELKRVLAPKLQSVPLSVQVQKPEPIPMSAPNSQLSAPQPESIPMSIAQPELIQTPELVPQLEPIRIPEFQPEPIPVNISQPTLPESAPQLELITTAISQPKPNSIPDPQPEQITLAEAVAQPDFILMPISQPSLPEPLLPPEQTPMIRLNPEPILLQDPEPEPIPLPESVPQQDTITELQPLPMTIPAPTLVPTPLPTPSSSPATIFAPALQPGSISQTIPERIQLTTPVPITEVVLTPAPVAQLPLAPQPAPASPQLTAQSLPIPQPEPEPVTQPLPPLDLIPLPASGLSPQPTYPLTTSVDVFTKPTTAIPSTSYTTMNINSTPNPTIPNQITPEPVQTLQDTSICKQRNTYYSVANKCDAYVECRKYLPEERLCPDGLHFNPNAAWPGYPCAYPFDVPCASGTVKQPSRPTEQCPRQYGYYPMNDGDCSKYIMCQGGIAKIMNCPLGLAFNPDLNSCDWPENVPRCNPNAFNDFACPSLGVDSTSSDIIHKYRYFNSCDTYVICQRGFPRLLSCDVGLFFDESSQACIDKDYVTDCDVPKQNSL